MVCCALVGLISPGLEAIRLMVSTSLQHLSRIYHTLVSFFGWLVNYSTVFQTSKIEHPHAPVCSTTHKYVNAVGTKPDIEHFFVVCDELCFGG